MTVAAIDDSFIHAVLKGHGELSSDGLVAAVTEFALDFGKQPARRRAAVDGVAGCAIKRGLEMLRAAEIHPSQILGVAGQAARNNLFGAVLGEGKNTGLGWRFDVF